MALKLLQELKNATLCDFELSISLDNLLTANHMSNLLTASDEDLLDVPWLAVKSNNIDLINHLLDIPTMDINDWTAKDGSSLLECAVASSSVDSKVIGTLIHHGADVRQGSLLQPALETKRPPEEMLSIVRLLLDAGAEIKFWLDGSKQQVRSTALHEAFKYAKTHGLSFDKTRSLLEEFLSRGFDIEAPNYDDNRILHVVIFATTNLRYANNKSLHGVKKSSKEETFNSNAEEVVDVEFDALGKQFDSKMGSSNSDEPEVLDPPLKRRKQVDDEVDASSDARHRNIQLIRWLLSQGADINATGRELMTPFTIAAVNHDMELLDMLQSAGARPDGLDAGGCTVLWRLLVDAEDDDGDDVIIDVINKLLKIGGYDINHRSADSSTALHVAVDRGRGSAIVECLLLHGADIGAQDYLGRTPLHGASILETEESPRLIALLLDHGADITAVDAHGYTALHAAALKGTEAGMRVLLKRGAPVDARGQIGVASIHLAAESDVGKIRALHEWDASVHSRDHYGATPLHYAAVRGIVENVEELIRLGADPHLKDINGHSALWHGRLHAIDDFSQLLNDDEVVESSDEVMLFNTVPVQGEEGIREHFEDIGNLFMSARCFQDDTCLAILNTACLGGTNFVDEPLAIRTAVDRFVDDLLKDVVESDGRFEGCIFRSGSSREGVKVGHPDEYDYMWILSEFTKEEISMEETANSASKPGFVQIKPSVLPAPQKFAQFLTTDGYFSTTKFLIHFKYLLDNAYYRVSRRHMSNLFFYKRLYDEYMTVKSGGIDMPTDQCLAWRGATYKFLGISYDIVPSVYLPCWPLNAIPMTHLLPEQKLSDFGIHLVPKMWCNQAICPMDENGIESEDSNETYWRISFSHVEMAIMHSVSNAQLRSYLLAKSFREEPLACRIALPAEHDTYSDLSLFSSESNSDASGSTASGNSVSDHECFDEERLEEPHSMIPSYQLKMIFFHEIERLALAHTEVSSCQLTLALFRKLRECIESNKLPSFIIREHNVYRKYKYNHQFFTEVESTTRGSGEKDYVKIYVDQVIKLMERLRFDEPVAMSMRS